MLPLTPQRLHAELLVTSAMRLQSYLQGALKDATKSALHRTHRRVLEGSLEVGLQAHCARHEEFGV